MSMDFSFKSISDYMWIQNAFGSGKLCAGHIETANENGWMIYIRSWSDTQIPYCRFLIDKMFKFQSSIYYIIPASVSVCTVYSTRDSTISLD